MDTPTPSHQTVEAFTEFMPQCKFCDERGVHDCPGGEASPAGGGTVQVFPGKVDARMFAVKECHCFGGCFCPSRWDTRHAIEREYQRLCRDAVGKAVHP